MTELFDTNFLVCNFRIKSTGFLPTSSDDLLLFLAGRSTECLHIYSMKKITSLCFYIFLYILDVFR